MSQNTKNYQQNILEKFNKRKNVILFLDNFEDNEENNIKYIKQINGIIPTSKSPIIILTNNLYLLSNNLVFGNSAFQSRYIPYQIENEGISHKELPLHCIQYHPEAGPGPNDTRSIFDEFNQMMEDY